MLGFIVVIITCTVNLSLGLLVLLRNPKRRVSIVFFLVSLFISLWAVSNHVTSSPSIELTVNNIFNRLAFFTAFMAVGSSVWFSTLFPKQVQWKKKWVLALLVMSSSVGLISLSSSVSGEVTRTNGELHFSVGPLLPIYIAAIAILFGLLAINLVQSFRKARGGTRQQALLILLGFGLPIVLGLTTNAILPSVTSNWQSADFGPAFTILLVGIISFAIIRHHLFDIRLAVARSFAYLLSILAVALLYAVAAFSIYDVILGGDITLQQEVFFAAFSAVAALAFHPLKKIFDKLTNHFFYRDAYDSQAFIDRLNRSLVTYTDLNRLLVDSATIIRDTFKADFCLYGVSDPNNPGKPFIIGSDKKEVLKDDIVLGQHVMPKISSNVIVADNLEGEHARFKIALERANVALLVRLTSDPHDQESTIGYLIVGNKKSGNPYNSEDIRLLDITANGLVIALQNAYRFQEIQVFNQTLQDKIEEATRKLRQTNDKLRKLDETKDDFISMASHQLRTPLTSVKGYVSMVLDGDAGKITALQRKLLTQSFISSQRMVYLISDLLNVSRLKTGKFIIEAVPTNLANVIEEEIDQLQETAKGRNLELIYKKPEHFPTLMLDETKIRQVLMNFIDNAVYYTPSGGHITINLVDKGRTIEYTVVDDGIGVAKHEQHHLFSKFFRAHNAKRARPDGTGLGLFMAKKVIIAQGGAIIFKSQEGRGSTFGFTFAKERLLPEKAKASTTTTTTVKPAPIEVKTIK